MADNKTLGARADYFDTHNSKLAHDVADAVATVSLQEQEGEDTTVKGTVSLETRYSF